MASAAAVGVEAPLGAELPWSRLHENRDVRRRLVEFLGGPPLEAATAWFLTRPRPVAGRAYLCLPTGELWTALAADPELARSLWDREALLVDLDLEHVHFDRPWAPLLDPARSFALQRPVARAIELLLASAGIRPLHLLSGRGHHFLWRIGRASRTFNALVELGTLPATLAAAYERPQRPEGARVGLRLGKAWSGLGKVIERLGHRVLEAAAPATSIPVQLTAVISGPTNGEREVVSLDLSAFADPLHRRSVRLPFTAYRRTGDSPAGVAPRVGIPLAEGESDELESARTPERAVALAPRVSCAIPEASDGTEALIAEYRSSELAGFHRTFETGRRELPESWSAESEERRLASLPPCVAEILRHPNDLLLRPAGIQHVVRALVALGWQPRQVTELIRSKYDEPHGWLAHVHFHDASVRAELYTRLFAGLVSVGRDQLVDFNCASSQEKGLCPLGGCPWNLVELRDRMAKEASDG